MKGIIDRVKMMNMIMIQVMNDNVEKQPLW